jgi:hypothetical protein
MILDSNRIIQFMPRSLAQLTEEYRRLATSLGDSGYVVQGSVFERRAGPGSRYQWTWKNKRQKTESLTLTKQQYDWLRRAVANERTLKSTLRKMRRISEQIFALSTAKSPYRK